MEQETVSENILEAVRAHRCILREERTTHLDMWISYLAFLFDLNFPSSFCFIKEHDYINHNIDRMEYAQQETRVRMEKSENCVWIIWREKQSIKMLNFSVIFLVFLLKYFIY